MIPELPKLEQVVITHYQCQDFSVGNQIHSMQLYAEAKASEFKDTDEAVMIQRFCKQVTSLQQAGLLVVHWSQNRPHFGPDHIRSRYRELTGEDIELDYQQSINLSDWLKQRYGEDYLPQDARLDQLAHLNHLQGARTEGTESRIFGTNRLILIRDIYTRARQNKLTATTGQREISAPVSSVQPEHSFASYLHHEHPDQLAIALRKEFTLEKGKSIRLLIEVLSQQNLLRLCTGQHKQLYTAMTAFFGPRIGSYNGIFGYKIVVQTDKNDMDALAFRVLNILSRLTNPN